MKQPTQPKKYGMVQLPEDVHIRLRDYCKKHGFNIGGFVAALVRQAIQKG